MLIAEGIRSTTRNSVFGAEPDVRDLGFYTAYCTIPRTAAGRSLQLRPDDVGTTRASLTFASAQTASNIAIGPGRSRRDVYVYADVGHLVPRVLADLAEDSSSLYLDRIAQVRLPSWSVGRVAVVGDAAQNLPPGVPGIANPSSRLGVTIFRSAVRLAGTRPGRALVSRLMSSSETPRPLPVYDDEAPARPDQAGLATMPRCITRSPTTPP